MGVLFGQAVFEVDLTKGFHSLPFKSGAMIVHAAHSSAALQQLQRKADPSILQSLVQSIERPPDEVFTAHVLLSRYGEQAAGGTQLQTAAGEPTAAAGEGLLPAGLWLQTGTAEAGGAACTEGETVGGGGFISSAKQKDKNWIVLVQHI